jgi:hypothetical protein
MNYQNYKKCFSFKSNPYANGIPTRNIIDPKRSKKREVCYLCENGKITPNTRNHMSLQCPLCGKSKASEALFCESCSNKIRTNYEVELPNQSKREVEPIVSRQEVKPEIVEQIAAEPIYNSEKIDVNDNPEEKKPERSGEKRKKGKLLLRIVILLFVLTGAFLVYNETIRKSSLERIAWGKALEINTIGGYLDYMSSFPNSVHFADAQTLMRSLKEGETTEWQRIKTTNNPSDLRDFLHHYPETPYRSLVEIRLDSLSWIEALKANRVEAYSDYILQVEIGDFNGEYLSLAKSCYNMLFQSYPVNEADLEFIRRIVGEFFNSLSSLDGDGIRRHLAPVVNRFFETGRTSREQLIERLQTSTTYAQNGTIHFVVDESTVQYEKTMEDGFKVNIPITKIIEKDESTTTLPGFIVHMEIDSLFQIISVYETKPYPELR